MSTETNKNIIRRLNEEVWERGNLAIVDELCASDAIFHTNDPLTPDYGSGPKALKQIFTLYRAAFPDTKVTLDDLIAEEDRVVTRWTARGTHKGDLLGTAPTNKQVTVTGMDIYRIVDGKIKENWGNWDTMGMMQQLGIAQKAGKAAKK